MFLMIEGIDGSGKSTIVDAVLEYFRGQNKRVFDIKAWVKENRELPEPGQFDGFDVMAGHEPTYGWIGACIRSEMTAKNGRTYESRDIAAAFALDRLVLYTRCYLPALKNGKIIVADRGVATSLVYQPVMDKSITDEEVRSLHGNAFALEHAPDHLLIADVDPKIAIDRALGRLEKQDNSIFEKESLLATFHDRYHSDWFRDIFEARGTKVHFIDTSGSLENTRERTRDLIATLLFH